MIVFYLTGNAGVSVPICYTTGNECDYLVHIVTEQFIKNTSTT